MKKSLIMAVILSSLFLSIEAIAQIDAKSAWNFMESVGVCTHFDYTEQPYVKNFDQVKGLIGELGVRYARDKAPHIDSASRNRCKQVNSAHGIQFLVPFSKEYYTESEIDNKLNDIAANAADIILAYEGPNEVDMGKDGYNKPCCWTNDLHNNQQYIFNAVNGHSHWNIKNKMVISPSPTFPWQVSWMGDFTSIADRYNIHSYHGEGHPESDDAKFVDYLTAIPNNNSDPKARWKIWASEAGYHDRLASNGVPEDVEGKYIPRMLLLYFNKGINKTFVYELCDGPYGANTDRGHFGLLRSNLTKKPSFTSMSNMLHILDDDSNITPHTLNASFENTDGIKYVLLEKSNGKFYLCVWQDLSCYNGTSTISNAGKSIKFNCNFSSAKLYEPGTSVNPIKSFNGASSIDLWVKDQVRIYEFTGASTKSASLLNTPSTEESNINGFSMVPNPAKDYIEVYANNSYSVAIYNLQGKILLSKDQLKGKVNLDISGIVPGMYIVRCISEGTIKTKQLLVE